MVVNSKGPAPQPATPRTPPPPQALLIARHAKAQERRFTGAPITGFGGL